MKPVNGWDRIIGEGEETFLQKGSLSPSPNPTPLPHKTFGLIESLLSAFPCGYRLNL